MLAAATAAAAAATADAPAGHKRVLLLIVSAVYQRMEALQAAMRRAVHADEVDTTSVDGSLMYSLTKS
jgi:hypothetical protein